MKNQVLVNQNPKTEAFYFSLESLAIPLYEKDELTVIDSDFRQLTPMASNKKNLIFFFSIS